MTEHPSNVAGVPKPNLNESSPGCEARLAAAGREIANLEAIDGLPGALQATMQPMAWWFYALIAALAASATAILAKVGVKDVPSSLATAIRTVVIVVFAWSIAFATREHQALPSLKLRSVVFLVLSGIATGISWIAYFKALQMAPASRVAPIDKVSLAFTILLAALVLGEEISWKMGLGTALMIAGALLTISR